MRTKINIGLIGAGFMGRCHANAFRAVGGLFDLEANPEPFMLADISQEAASENARKLGFRHATGDWMDICRHPDIDLVSITAPNVLHEPIALAAIDAGKAVYCEKPLAVDAKGALRMTEAAESKGIANLVGFNFLHNPAVRLAKDMIESGKIGEVFAFRGRHAESYMVDRGSPHTFRTDPKGGGALADIGSHIISMARFLVGPICKVSANCKTLHTTRPISPGSMESREVVVDDLTHALVVFENGATGSIEANWVAHGRNMDLCWEITGTKGALRFSQERMNELLFFGANGNTRSNGFVRIETGPEHPPYGAFCPAPGHHLGFNELKIIEVAELLAAVAGKGVCRADFREAYRIQLVVDAMLRSHSCGKWVSVQMH